MNVWEDMDDDLNSHKTQDMKGLRQGENMKENEVSMKEYTSGETRKVKLGDTGVIELPSIDVSKYVGRKVPIAMVEEMEGKFGFFIKISTISLDEIEKSDKSVIQLTASRVFGLFTDKDGKIGWGKDTQLGVYLAKMKVSHYKELVGKQVTVQTVTSKKDGKDYLTFN